MSNLMMMLQAAADPEVQKVISPPPGGVSPLAWVIICGLAAAVVALGKFCLTLYADLKEARKELAESYEDQASTLRALRSGLDMPKPMTHVPPPALPTGGNQGGQP